MAASKRAAPTESGSSDVEDFMAKLDHPLKAELQTVRTMILGADPSIVEGIKWNSPSFRTKEYFATTNIRGKDVIQVIMHFGAKVNEISATGVVIDDPEKLLTWLGKDRATIKFADMKSIQSKHDAFSAILRQWITHVK